MSSVDKHNACQCVPVCVSQPAFILPLSYILLNTQATVLVFVVVGVVVMF